MRSPVIFTEDLQYVPKLPIVRSKIAPCCRTAACAKSRHVGAPCRAALHADGAAPLPLQGGLEQVYRAALALGTANQLTNILRDVGEDVNERNRIYVPLDELDQFGIRESEVQDVSYCSLFVQHGGSCCVGGVSQHVMFVIQLTVCCAFM